MKPIRLAAGLGAAFMLSATVSTIALAQAPVCSAPVKVLAQPRDGLTLLEDSKAEFEKLATKILTATKPVEAPEPPAEEAA